MSSILRAQALRRTASGAEYLDMVAPVHPDIVPVRWYNVVNLNFLDLASSERCMLAQIGQASRRYALLSYSHTAEALGLDPYPNRKYHSDVIEFGFRAGTPEMIVEEYRELTIAWKRLILERRADDFALSLAS